MNREIKFRVWDRALNKMITKENVKGLLDTVNTGDWDTDYTYSRDEWYPAYDILTIFDYFEDIQDRYIEDTSTKRFELMQYTGLHDGNGKEIYEGDIIEFSYDEFIGNFDTKVGRGTIEFIDGAFYIKPFEIEGKKIKDTDTEEWFLLYTVNTDTLKVLGNVHENLELLGGK